VKISKKYPSSICIDNVEFTAAMKNDGTHVRVFHRDEKTEKWQEISVCVIVPVNLSAVDNIENGIDSIPRDETTTAFVSDENARFVLSSTLQNWVENDFDPRLIPRTLLSFLSKRIPRCRASMLFEAENAYRRLRGDSPSWVSDVIHSCADERFEFREECHKNWKGMNERREIRKLAKEFNVPLTTDHHLLSEMKRDRRSLARARIISDMFETDFVATFNIVRGFYVPLPLKTKPCHWGGVDWTVLAEREEREFLNLGQKRNRASGGFVEYYHDYRVRLIVDHKRGNEIRVVRTMIK